MSTSSEHPHEKHSLEEVAEKDGTIVTDAGSPYVPGGEDAEPEPQEYGNDESFAGGPLEGSGPTDDEPRRDEVV